MAKIKVRPRPGALSKLLKEKGLTQMDAQTKTHVDRKTLLKIERGEEVKLETLQQVATKLQVTQEYFCNPSVGHVAENDDPLDPGNIMLRKLDGERLEQLLEQGPLRVRWQLNAQVRDNVARKILEELEEAVQNFRQQIELKGYVASDGSEPTDSLRFQLSQLKTAEDTATLLQRLAEHRLTVLGADYLFWEKSDEEVDEDMATLSVHFHSSRIVLLSVEASGTQSRRVRVFQGSIPPLFAPDPGTSVFVNGEKLLSLEEI
jgi:transcriptional regulator with XRE-family HTH domain